MQVQTQHLLVALLNDQRVQLREDLQKRSSKEYIKYAGHAEWWRDGRLRSSGCML
jgi:hypothetical protein